MLIVICITVVGICLALMFSSCGATAEADAYIEAAKRIEKRNPDFFKGWAD